MRKIKGLDQDFVATVAIHMRPSGLHGRLRALRSELRRIFHDRLDLLLEFFDVGLG